MISSEIKENGNHFGGEKFLKGILTFYFFKKFSSSDNTKDFKFFKEFNMQRTPSPKENIKRRHFKFIVKNTCLIES